jgi:predicted MPP superfamily phosphohydrolase
MKIHLYKIIIVLITLIFVFIKYNNFNSQLISKQEIKYQNIIDLLSNEIDNKNIIIKSLDSTRKTLDSSLIINKNELIKISIKADKYKKEYDKEHNRIINMSDNDIISEFTDTFN